MKSIHPFQFFVLALVLSTLLWTCNSSPNKLIQPTVDQNQNEKAFHATLQKLLQSIENKDLEAMKSTLAPNGEMQLILPNSPIIFTAKGFLDMHKEWFQDSTWTMKHQVLNAKVGDRIGIATVDAMYKEPNRNGKPYFNNLMVSYTLEKIENQWYLIKDHACSFEKTKAE